MALSNNPLRKLKHLRRTVLKASIIPFAVVSSLTLPSPFNSVHASINTYRPSELEGESLWDTLKRVFGTIGDAFDWVINIRETLPEFTFNFMSSIYEVLSTLILKTPLWIFDNTFFDNSTFLMSVLSVTIVTILTTFEGLKKMCKKKSVDIKTIAKRWFVVAGLSSIAPTILKKGFQLLNWASDQIISLNSSTITSAMSEAVIGFDMFVLLIFNIVMLGLSVPILLKNARRFWDILTLGIMSPLAGVAWIFKPYNHLFKQWWSNLKEKSLFQLVYAFYLLIIGLFIYGVPTPPTMEGQLIKLLMVIGGFFRLVDPPAFVQKHLGSNSGIDDLGKEIKQKVKKVKGGYDKGIGFTKKSIKSVTNFSEFISGGKTPTVANSNTRMGRYHYK